MTRWIAFSVTAIVAFILDIATKYWAFNMSGLKYSERGPRDIMEIIPGYFDFVLAMNKGAAFSMLSGRFTFFMIISVVAILTLIYFVHIAEPDQILQPVIIGLIFAGVLGNFWDRVIFEGVRDFISWHTPGLPGERYEWPTFNVADIWICVGAVTMALFFWNNPEEEAGSF